MLKDKDKTNKVIKLLCDQIELGKLLANTDTFSMFKGGGFFEHSRTWNGKLDSFLTKVENWDAVNEEILRTYFEEYRFIEDYRKCKADIFNAYFTNKVVKARDEIHKKINYFNSIITRLRLLQEEYTEPSPLKSDNQGNQTDNNSDAPSVFISYSWDNDEHKAWVLSLAEKLAQNYIYVYLDRYDLTAGKDMTHFMENAVSKSRHVLIILTPNYKLKAEKRKGGVGYETSIITAEIFKSTLSDKFIPILKNGTAETSVPTFLGTKINIDMTNDSIFKESFEQLVRTIHHEPLISRPPLGKRPSFRKK